MQQEWIPRYQCCLATYQQPDPHSAHILALAPVALPAPYTERYSNTLRLYYTNSVPTETGLTAFTGAILLGNQGANLALKTSLACSSGSSGQIGRIPTPTESVHRLRKSDAIAAGSMRDRRDRHTAGLSNIRGRGHAYGSAVAVYDTAPGGADDARSFYLEDSEGRRAGWIALAVAAILLIVLLIASN